MKADFSKKLSKLTGKIETSQNGYDKYIAISILFLFSLLCLLFVKLTGHPDIISDGLGYWKYLPGLFINKDLSFRNAYTIGVALMEIPFFLAAHVFSILTNIYEADGYSLPYRFSSLLAQMFYSNLGLIYVYKHLRKFYSVKTSAIALATIAFSTSLFFYTVFGYNFSHVFSFCAVAMFLYYVFKAYETARIKDHIIVGLLLGVVACCRVTNVIVVLIYIFYGIKSPSEFMEKARLKKTYIQFAASFISFLLVFSLQMLYWKHAFGAFIVNSYGDQGFPYLLNPQVYNILFSKWRGLFVWHPIYLLVFIGFYFVFKDKNHRNHLFGIVVFFIIYLWITSAWWCWWYGWSFGQRPFNDILAVLALPLAALIEKINSISLPLFGEAHSPLDLKTTEHKNYTPVSRLPLVVLAAFITLFSIRNLNFSLLIKEGLFPITSPDIHSHLPYRFRDFMFISRPNNLFKDKIIWSDSNQFLTASFGNPTTFAAYHGVEFATGPEGERLHGFKIAGDGKAYYKSKEILNTDDLNLTNYQLGEIDTGKKWINGETVYRHAFSGAVIWGGNVNLLDNVAAIVDCGGSIKISPNLYVQLGASGGNRAIGQAYTSCVFIYAGNLQLSADTNTAYEEGYYEIWVEYTKGLH